MKTKYFSALFFTVFLFSGCAPAYYESVFKNENEISSKDQLRLKGFIEAREWDSAYKIANTYPQVQNTFHDIGRIQDAIQHYDVCKKGSKRKLFRCLDSQSEIFNQVPEKTHLGKPTRRFVSGFLASVRSEIKASKKEIKKKRKVELVKIKKQDKARQRRNAEKKRLLEKALVAKNKQKATKKFKPGKLKRRLYEINWTQEVGEAGIRGEMAVADLPFEKIFFDMKENKDKSYNFSLVIMRPKGVDITPKDLAVKKSLEIILKNIGDVTRQTKLRSRHLFVTYKTANNNLQYQFETKEARTYLKKLESKHLISAQKYIKSVSKKALDRHKKGM